MAEPLLERRSPLKISYALLILTVFFFFLPSAFRAARLSLGKKENDVKDWLPSDFTETAELAWFAKHYIGDSFVLATWPGCVSGDQRLELLTRKLRHESDLYDPATDSPPELAEQYRRAKKVGRELQLLIAGDDHYDWAGKKEKWLSSATGTQYFITPDGKLYRWEESTNGPAALVRSIRRGLGTYEVKAQLVTAFADGSLAANRTTDQRVNPFHNDPSLICAPLFHSVQTGDTVVNQLAVEGGPLWPIDLTDADLRETVAKRRAMERLTGTLFAPAVPDGFSWRGEDFAKAIPDSRRASLPTDFTAIADLVVRNALRDRFGDSMEQLAEAPIEDQTKVWYEVYDTAGVEPPPRLTCVLVTLTPLANDQLSFVLGRGVLGNPRGRLLQLAEECGVEAAPPPSMAPPPLDRLSQAAATGKPQLHMGGPPVDNVAIDEEGSVTLVRLVGYSVLVGVVLSYLCLSSIKLTLMVFIVGGSSAMLSMAIVWWSGGRVDAILMSMPSLVYVLGLSGAIHVINYYRDEVRSGGQKGAAGRAIRHAAMPCFLASATTAIGLASLGTSNLAPISNFGIYAAVGVLATLAILFSYLPAALETFVPRAVAETAPMPDGPPVESRMSEYWASIGRWITGHHVAVTTACLLVLAVASLGMFKIRTSVQLLKLFDPDSRIISDYAWLESNFGKLVPMELVVRVPPTMQREYNAENAGDEQPGESEVAPAVSALSVLERVEAVSRIRRVVHRILGEPGLDIVGQAMSADTFLPPLPPPSNSYTPVRARFERELLTSREELKGSDYYRIEREGPFENSELWRISLRVAALSDVDYGRFISTLRTAVEPVLRAYETRGALLAEMTAGADATGSKLTGRERVLILGSATPPTIENLEVGDNADPTRPSDDAIDRQQTYLATLAELMSGERMRQPVWLDPTAADSPVAVGDDKWKRLIESVDAVIWVDGKGIREQDLAQAKLVIDARSTSTRITIPTLIDGTIPDVEGADGLQVVYTGVIPVVYKAQRTLLTSLMESIGSAFIMISGVMIVLLNPGRFPLNWLTTSHFSNGFAAGIISMIPNLFPILFVFGVMGHAGVLVDIGTMMTASVAMGVAVDDTIHFLSWFRHNLNAGMSRVDAVIETYRRVGPAMTQTTIVGGLGLFVFALSTFTPTQRFGTLMLVLLAVALVGDLVLLPALLAGPLGRFFKPQVGTGPATDVANRPAGHKPHTDEVIQANVSPSHPITTEVDDETESTTTDTSSSAQQDRHRLLKPHASKKRRSDSPHRFK